MAYLEWTSNLSVGNATLDGHHKTLIDLINTVFIAKKAMAAGKVNAALNDLFDYTRYHFAEEEKMMAAAGFPDLEEHRRVHAEMIRQVVDLRHRHSEGNAHISADELFDFLSQWLIRHIVGKDLRFRPYVQ